MSFFPTLIQKIWQKTRIFMYVKTVDYFHRNIFTGNIMPVRHIKMEEKNMTSFLPKKSQSCLSYQLDVKNLFFYISLQNK